MSVWCDIPWPAPPLVEAIEAGSTLETRAALQAISEEYACYLCLLPVRTEFGEPVLRFLGGEDYLRRALSERPTGLS